MTSNAPPLFPGAAAPPRRSTRDWLLLLALGALFVAGTTLALVVQWPAMGQYTLRVGNVSPTDIRSPQLIEYLSEVLTEDARVQAERRVVDVYEPVRRVRSEQMARAEEVAALVSAANLGQPARCPVGSGGLAGRVGAGRRSVGSGGG